MKILLVGEIYSENLGDALLCSTVNCCICDEFPDAEIIPFDISGRTDFGKQYQMKRRTRSQKWFVRFYRGFPKILNRISPLFRCYSQSIDRFMRVWYMIDDVLRNNRIDLVVFAGGEMFMDYFTGPIYILLKSCKHINVIFHACGQYNLSADSCKILKKYLKRKNVKSISLRDSYDIFTNKVISGSKVSRTYDTALYCSYYLEDFKASEKSAEIGLGIIGKKEYFNFQSELVADFIKSSYDWKLFTNGASEDYKYACRLLEYNGIPESEIKNYLVNRPFNVAELINVVTSFNKIISFRMHSQICAMSFGIPAFGLVWDNKIVELYEKMELVSNFETSFNDINLEKYIFALNNVTSSVGAKSILLGEESKKSLLFNINKVLSG